MHSAIPIFTTLCIVLLFQPVVAQFVISPGLNNLGSDYVPDLGSVKIQNSGPQTSVRLVVEVSDENGRIIGEGKSGILSLVQGESTLLKSDISGLKWTYLHQDGWSGNLLLPVGSYQIIYHILHATEEVELALYQMSIQVQAKDVRASESLELQQSKPVTFHGNGEVSGQVSTRPQSFSTVPQNYFQAYINPTLTLFDVPISARFFYSTQQQAVGQNMTSFNVDFDGDQFKSILMKKLLTLLSNNQQFQQLNGYKDQADLNQLKGYQDIFNNPEVQKELGQLAMLDSLKGMQDSLQNLSHMQSLQNRFTELGKDSLMKLMSYKDSVNIPDSLAFIQELSLEDTSQVSAYWDQAQGMQSGEFERDSLQSQLDSIAAIQKGLKWLEQKREGYDKLMKKKQELETVLQKSGLLDSTGNLLDPKSYTAVDMEKLKDPEGLYSQLKSSNLLGKFHKILFYVDKISIGQCFPRRSDFSLNNQRINGFNIEINPKGIIAAFTYGQAMDPVLSSNLTQASYRRNLMGGTVGYGNPDKSFIKLHWMRAMDDTNSINPRDSLYVNFKTPQSNYVMAANFQVKLFKEKFTFSGEIAGSQTVKDLAMLSDTNFTVNPNATGHTHREWFTNIFTQRAIDNNTRTGYAVEAKLEGLFWKGQTQVSVSYKRISAGFRSFGVPFLVNDIQLVEGKVSQKIWKNRIQLGGTVRHSSDNLEGEKLLTSNRVQFGFDVAVNIPKGPRLRGSYVPLTQGNDSVKVFINVMNISASYQFKKKQNSHVVTAAYIMQNCASQDSLLNFQAHNFLANYVFTMKTGIQVIGSASYIRFISHTLPSTHSMILTAGTGFTAWKIWTNSAGASLIYNFNEVKYGFYYQTSIPFLHVFTFNLRIETNQYNSIVTNPYIPVPYFSEFTARAGLGFKW